MFAPKLIQHIEDHADSLSEALVRKIKTSGRCSELLNKVPAEELHRRTYEIYRNLADWLLNKTESEIEERYIGLGTRRARQGVPFSHFYWAVCATKECLWEYIQREGVFEEAIDLWGEIELLHSLEQFFDSALYYALIGYESAQTGHAAATFEGARH